MSRIDASFKFGKHVVRNRDAFGEAVADERVRSGRRRTSDISRNREGLAIEFEGEACGNETSGIFRSFGYEGSSGIRGNEGIADGKMVRHGFRS